MDPQAAQAKSSSKNWVLLLVITIIGALGTFVVVSYFGNYKDQITSPVHVKQATQSIAKRETASWNTFTNEKRGYSIKYPKDWLVNSYKAGECKGEKDGQHVYFAPSKDLLGKCSEEFGAFIEAVFTDPPYNNKEQLKGMSQFKLQNLSQKELKIAGKNAVRVEGISQLKDEFIDLRGYKMIVYMIDLGTYSLDLAYLQSPKTTDYSKEFELMVFTFSSSPEELH